MPFIANTDDQRKEMLDEIGLSMEDLFGDIPSDLMCVYLVTLLTVGCVSAAAFSPAGFVGRYQFGDSGKRFSEKHLDGIAHGGGPISSTLWKSTTTRYGRCVVGCARSVRPRSAGRPALEAAEADPVAGDGGVAATST